MSSCAHICLYLGHQEFPKQWRPHAWWGFVVSSVNCMFVCCNMHPRTTSAASLPSPQLARLLLGKEGCIGTVGAGRRAHHLALEAARVHHHQPDCWHAASHPRPCWLWPSPCKSLSLQILIIRNHNHYKSSSLPMLIISNPHYCRSLLLQILIITNPHYYKFSSSQVLIIANPHLCKSLLHLSVLWWNLSLTFGKQER